VKSYIFVYNIIIIGNIEEGLIA